MLRVKGALFGTVLGGLALASGCAPTGGAQRDVLNSPLRKDYVQIVSATASQVEVDSAGRVVRAKAPDGFCIPNGSIQTLGNAVFMVVAPCAGGPESVGGVLSLSIANGPMSAGLDELETRFQTQVASSQLGYGGGADDVSVLSSMRDDDALYVLVEDQSEFGPAFAGDIICRAFLEVNGRLAVASLISLRDATRSQDELRAELERLVDAVRAANA